MIIVPEEMSVRPFRHLVLLLLAILLILPASRMIAAPLRSLAPTPNVTLRWAADDATIAAGAENRTWTWGPQIFRSGPEPYAEGPNGARNVWYLDKARMEITNPGADPDAAWYVSSGLLVRELMSGRMQIGDTQYETREPADVPLAGDLDAPITQTLSFLDLQPLASLDNDKRAPSRVDFDAAVAELLGKGGLVTQDERFLQYDVRLRAYDDVLGHNIPNVFTDAMPPDKLLYIAGRPLSEPYWAIVPVKRVPTDVLIQAFERRILTYTPSNPEGWKVEWGNVGRQYAQWRYTSADDGAPYDPQAALDAPPTLRPLAELAPQAAQIVQQRGESVGVAVLDMQTDTLYSANGTRAFPMYSTAKVPIMLGVLDKVQREKRGVADWEDSLIRPMIQQSDNDAATTLIIQAGGGAAVNRYLRAIGIQNTTMSDYAWGASTTTAEDMTLLMSKLGACTILNAELCQYAIDIMRGVTPDQAWGISAGVPGSVAIALKNGWFPDTNGWGINSMGYVKGNRKRYAIAVFTQGNASMRTGIDTIEAISAQIYPAVP